MAKYFNINDFYKTAIDCAIDADPRGRDIVEKELDIVKKDYEAIKDKRKKVMKPPSLKYYVLTLNLIIYITYKIKLI